MACCHQAKCHYLSHVDQVLCYHIIWCYQGTMNELIVVLWSQIVLSSDWSTLVEVMACCHDVIMGAITSQITNLMIVYSTVYSDADQKKHQSFVSLAFVRGIQRGLVNSPHKWPVTRKMFPFHNVIMLIRISGTFVIICSYMYFLNQCCELGTWEWSLCENIRALGNDHCVKIFH